MTARAPATQRTTTQNAEASTPQPLPAFAGDAAAGGIPPGVDLPVFTPPGRLIVGTGDGNFMVEGFGAFATTNGPDTVYGMGGDDIIETGWGNDYIEGGVGNDRVDAGVGRDTIYGGQGLDSLHGGSGDDFMSGGTEADWLSGGDGNDTLIGGPGDDTMLGGEDADTIYFGEGRDFIQGDDGNDVFIVWKGQNDTNLGTVAGGAGFDTIVLPDGTALSSIRYDDDAYEKKNPGKLTFGVGADAAEIRLSSIEWIQVDGVYHPIADFLI